LVWTGVGFSYFGVSLGVAAVMMARMKVIESRQVCHAAQTNSRLVQTFPIMTAVSNLAARVTRSRCALAGIVVNPSPSPPI
jgi:hypothetical protein